MCERQGTNAFASATTARDNVLVHSTGTAHASWKESEWSGIASAERQRLAARLVAAWRLSPLWETEIRPHV